ncbi:MAG: hypothetical protein ACLSW7_02840 [Acutalibacteraceae bacterium]|nr:hypothetical protein [Clostridiales bacterium]MEE0156507.1 hypothetical protein [Acutalibacteraceae bacterium]
MWIKKSPEADAFGDFRLAGGGKSMARARPFTGIFRLCRHPKFHFGEQRRQNEFFKQAKEEAAETSAAP